MWKIRDISFDIIINGIYSLLDNLYYAIKQSIITKLKPTKIENQIFNNQNKDMIYIIH